MIKLRRNSLTQSKLQTFIGFAIKSRNIKCGVNAVSTLKRANMLIICSTATENTFKDAEKLAKKLFAKLYVLEGVKLEDLVLKSLCKLVAITDKGLADAIKNCNDNRLREYSGGITL